MKNWLKFFGVITICAITGFSLAGCTEWDDEEEDGDGAPTSFKNADIYTIDGELYSGTGTEEPVKGFIQDEEDGEPANKPLGDDDEGIGTISADGKLTLTFPETVPDDKLVTDMSDGIKNGHLGFTPTLFLYNEDTGDTLGILYFNKAFSSGGIKQGWNYMSSSSSIITDLSGYKWVIVTQGE